jgi:hypothetical protein
MKMIGGGLGASVRGDENKEQIETDAEANAQMRVEAGGSHHD